MIIDLHCHTKYSGDTDLEPAELIEAARAAGLDAICITEHDSFCASEPVERVAEREAFPVFRGVEINTNKGHILAFGVEDDSWKALKGYYSHIASVRPVIEACEGILAPSHPFRMGGSVSASNSLFEMDYIAAIEALNGYNNDHENALALKAWKQTGLPGIGGSDCHFAQNVGRCATFFENPVSTMAELVAEVKAGRVWPVYRDAAGDYRRTEKPI
jgi:hypothetical protein